MGNNTSAISLVMIARNEAHDLPNCLASVKGLVDDIVLVDNNSTDDTVKIAKQFGVKVEQRKFDGFANQKNHAINMAKNNWILHLDPDEQITPELKQEISNIFPNTIYSAFDIPYQNIFLGKKMRFGSFLGEKHIRLFKKSASKFGGGLIHEGIRVNGEVGILKNKIIHNSYPNLEEYFKKFNEYTTLSAQKAYDEGKKFNILKLFAFPLNFLKLYILKLGILDGVKGLIWATISSCYGFVKYSKLYQIEKENKK